ncbi:MAG: helix-turn-helix transcriptional regulator [Proteobacteria bacterium]|nr:helix-turn-helix transcriptional regulator [Pseudomonadota bacterium]
MPKKQTTGVDSQIGMRLRVRRMLVGMSQEKLGEQLGLTFQQVQKYEKGTNRISASRLFQTAHILGVRIEYFFEGIHEELRLAGSHAAEDATPLPVMDFLSSAEGLQLSQAFMRIKDPKVRKRLLDLAKSLAAEQDD